jgi:FtsP/CotA-like multicopper oxidase with cupredoxin domain
MLYSRKTLFTIGLPLSTFLSVSACTPNTGDTTASAPKAEPVCSTIDQSKTGNCTFQKSGNGATTLVYALTNSLQAIKVPIGDGSQALTVKDALVYNGSLAPERLVLRRGDELRINFLNNFPQEADLPARFQCKADDKSSCIGYNADGEKVISPVATNLHTHGLVTPWDFKDSPGVRGDNVLTAMFNPWKSSKPLPANASALDICSSAGNQGSYRYTISPDHEIGLNWYHPHPHGVSGFQVEGGMSGLLMVADAEAEKYLSPIYLQLKDMQASKVTGKTDDTYQFEKFEPAVATACHTQQQDEDGVWIFDEDLPGRCNYHQVDADGKKIADYAWLFTVNGQLFPNINVPESAYFRVANSSANATYRLMLAPGAEQTQTQAQSTYYTPAFRVIEKDGMTTTDQAFDGKESQCTLTLTPATRVGFGVEFEDMGKNGTVCKLTVDKQTVNGKKTTNYTIEPVPTSQLSAEEKASIGKGKAPQAYTLIQEGIDTGEDDWPAIRLATLVPSEKMPPSNLVTYQKTVADNTAKIVNAGVKAQTDVLEPVDSCTASIPPADGDGINRHIALYYGADYDPTGKKVEKEHFGLVAAGEKNAGETVTRDTINTWREEYQKQFSGLASLSPAGLVEYDAPNLNVDALAGLKSHKFGYGADGNVITNICTKLSPQPEHWRIHNLSAQIHNFHIHQMKFKVLDVRGAACTPQKPALPGIIGKAFSLIDTTTGYLPEHIGTDMLKDALDEQCVKTYAEVFHDVPASFKLVEAAAPHADTLTRSAPMATATLARAATPDYGMHDTFPVPPMGYIDVEMAFNKPEQVGEYVFHCHILEHEDAGMMGKIVVKSR